MTRIAVLQNAPVVVDPGEITLTAKIWLQVFPEERMEHFACDQWEWCATHRCASLSVRSICEGFLDCADLVKRATFLKRVARRHEENRYVSNLVMAGSSVITSQGEIAMITPKYRFRAALAIVACLASAATYTAVKPLTFAPVTASVASTSDEVRDKLMIQDTMSSYVFALDTLDPEGVASKFTQDGIFTVGLKPDGTRTVRKGRAEIMAYVAPGRDRPNSDVAADTHGRRFSPVRHVVTSLIIDLQGDSATAESFWLEIKANGRNADGMGLPPTVRNMGRYEDIFVKQNGKWLIKQRTVVGDMWLFPRLGIDQPPARP